MAILNRKVPIYLLLSFIFLQTAGFADGEKKIMVINSNAGVGKYHAVHKEFKSAVSLPIHEIDLGKKTGMGDVPQPDLIYCIGAKACVFAKKNFSGVPLVFSSIINWRRLSLPPDTHGVSNELHARMPIFMFRSIFPEVKKIGILYSERYTLQWFLETRKQAEELSITVVGKTVRSGENAVPVLKQLIPEVDAVWLIPDPLVTPKKEKLYEILKICDRKKMPVFSYHSGFVKLGAVIAVSVDNPTIGRQAAGIASEILSKGEIDEKVQFPAGSSVTLNMKTVKAYNLKYNSNALSLVNNLIK